MEPVEFRRTLSQFATGITVITARDADGVAFGATVSSFGSLSLDPPLIQWSLTSRSTSHPRFAQASHFAVNILAADQEAVSRDFTRPIDRFATVDVEAGLEGLPLIRGCLAWLECAAEHQWIGGDHTVFVGRVLRGRIFDKTPLLHWRGAYMPVREWHAAARVVELNSAPSGHNMEEAMCLM